ncbi:MAG TPA: LysR substrate-binding domain-containing protein [Prosthecobacter sp.]
MELRHLRYFIAVAETENITRAAARLHLSQPPLTRQIRELEQEMGVELFHRTGKSIRLTEAGRVFLRASRAVLEQVAHAVEEARQAQPGHVEELHVGYAPSPTVELLPPVLKAFERIRPDVKVRLHDLSFPEMLTGLRTGKLQAALMMQPVKAALKGLCFEPLVSYPVMAAVPLKHAWARCRSVTPADILAGPMVAYSRVDYPDYQDFLVRRLGPAVRRKVFAEECDGGMSLIAAVESGKGGAVVASVFAWTAGKRLKLVPILPAPPAAVVGAAWVEGERNPAIEALLAAMREAVEQSR